jgi:hypothetical protein
MTEQSHRSVEWTGSVGEVNRNGDLEHSIEYFASASDAFERAVDAAESKTRVYDLDVAGFRIRLEFAGPAMVPVILPALGHRVRDVSGSSDLTIRIWDSESTGVAHPPPAWNSASFRERGEIQGFNNQRIKTCFQMGPDSLSIIDMEANRGYFWVRDAEDVPYYESGAPLRNLLHWWLGGRNHLFVHAAAVGTSASAGLLVGRGGSGKSTTALACLAAGLRYVSDDYCVVSLDGPPAVHSLYNTAKLTPDSIKRFPELAKAFDGIDYIEEDKRLFFLHPSFGSSIDSSLALGAVFVPRIVDSTETSVSRTSPLEALKSLAPSSIFQLAGAGGTEFARCSRLVRSLPCLSLDLGSDMRQSPDVIRDCLEGRIVE